MFLTRALTAALLLGAFLAALFLLPRAAFAGLVAVVVALGGAEWGRLAGMQRVPRLAFAACATVLYALVQWSDVAALLLWGAAIFWLLAVPWWLAAGVTPQPRAALLGAGIAALVPAGAAMATLPPRYLLMVMGLIWIADTAAYLVGSAIGRHKLAPSISPGKSWEGAGGAAAGVLIYAIICASFDPLLQALVQGPVWLPYLAGALLLCVASIVGDLFESALKRQAGAKDSGRLLPGHGGVLDRIDSATAALPLALLLMQAMGAP